MVNRTIETMECMAEGTAWLAGKDPHLARIAQVTGLPPLRRRADGFEALLNAIVSQQLSVAAAATIWKRIESAGLAKPRAILKADDEALRKTGLSRQKIRYARALAEAEIDFGQLREMPDEAVVARLVQVPGVGRWTAEIYAMFSLGRADVFAPGDLALREAARTAFDLPERPGEARLRDMARHWSPWRAVAARLLWAWYRVEKDREGVQ